ncbi:STAS domain-containing protein [Rugosimonospora africana]|uniref:Anti-sigma factor antagonist n=1 Tax=Rugosimonospora africana TaxID=556532 RepID=A0A8J3QR51_9ACTN|nr:STAS domain-containing protein [Rugosimonospora africana]GIH15900.1 anti-sigma factor antagonist [Rugosimonospora africana]
MSLAIAVNDEGTPAVIAVGGELDMNTSGELFDAAAALIDAGRRRLVLDLDQLTFCDSAGITAFVRLTKRAGEAGGALALARPVQIVESVLKLTGLVEVIPVFPTVEQARAALAT